jgi:raffinose/stachyose/melibiose transport system permease protein
VAFQHSLLLIVFYAVMSIGIGLFLTALLTRFRVRGFMFFRTVLFMPQTIATVVVAQAFTWIYDPSGPLNEFLRAIGLGFLTKTWLGDFTWALPSVGLIGTWLTFGLCIVLFLAGAQRIPSELYEAARVDGAGFVREFFAVTLPGLRNEIVVAATLTTILALRNFDIIYNTTSGGPGGETEVPSWVMFHNAFDLSRVGFAASIAVVLTVIITGIAVLIGRSSRRTA